MNSLERRDEQINLVGEAKHSFALMLATVGKVPAIIDLLIKWPDVVLSFVSCNDEMFNNDIAPLICFPMKCIAESLCEMSGDKNARDEINQTMLYVKADPVESKRNLIRICNMQLFKLKQQGRKNLPEPFKEYRHD